MLIFYIILSIANINTRGVHPLINQQALERTIFLRVYVHSTLFEDTNFSHNSFHTNKGQKKIAAR